jgi:hypothetical protein
VRAYLGIAHKAHQCIQKNNFGYFFITVCGALAWARVALQRPVSAVLGPGQFAAPLARKAAGSTSRGRVRHYALIFI